AVLVEGLVLPTAPDVGGTTQTRVPSGPIIVGSAILLAAALALTCRYTPLAVVLSYTPATLLMFPRWLITLAAVAIFGPWAAFAYAELGIVLAALCGYVLGKL